MPFNFKDIQEYKFYHLNIIEQDIKYLISAEKKITENSENFGNNLFDELKVRIRADKNLLEKPKSEQEEHDQSSYYEHYYGEANIFNRIIVENHRKSAVLSIFSLIEGQMKAICALIQEEFKFDIKVNDFNGSNYLTKSWTFLIKVYGLDKTEIEPLYTKIKQQQYIRNKIAHSNSSIEDHKIELVNSIVGLIAIRNTYNYYIRINDFSYIENLLKDAELLFEILIKKIELRYRELR